MGRCNRSGDVGEDEGEAMLYGERGRAGGGSTFIRTLLAGKSLPYPPKIYEGRQMPEFSHLAHHLSRNSMSKCSCPRFAAQQAAPPPMPTTPLRWDYPHQSKRVSFSVTMWLQCRCTRGTHLVLKTLASWVQNHIHVLGVPS